jgi:VanZ family protein
MTSARLVRWLPASLVVTVIFISSSIPSDELPSFGFWDTLVKKSGHVIGYGILALAFWFALEWKNKHFWLAFLLTFLYALTDEFHQSFTPGRHSSLTDALVFDSGGAFLSLFVFRWFRRLRRFSR